MAIIGAIIRDIIGSQYEFPLMRPNDLNWKTCELFTDKCTYTDDTVIAIATKYALETNIKFEIAYRLFGNAYQFDITESYIAEKAKESALCTHNHPEGIKGAEVTAVCGFMLKNGHTKKEIFEYADKKYNKNNYRFPVSMSMDELRKCYRWSETC